MKVGKIFMGIAVLLLLPCLAGCQYIEKAMSRSVSQDQLQEERADTEERYDDGETNAETAEDTGQDGQEQEPDYPPFAQEEPDETAAEPGEFEETVIDVFLPGTEDGYWRAVRRGAKKAQEDLGIGKVNIHISADGGQRSQVATAVAAGSDAVCIAPDSGEELAALLEPAADAGIPLIGMDASVLEAESGPDLYYTSTDHYASGQLAATNLYVMLKDRLPETSAEEGQPLKVLLLLDHTDASHLVQRAEGFADKFMHLAGYDKVSVRGPEVLAYEVEVPAVVVEVITGGPDDISAALGTGDASAVFAASQNMAEQLLAVNEALGVLGNSVIGIGFDSGARQQEAVREEILAGAVSQNPYQIGYMSVKTAAHAAVGKQAQSIDTGCQFYKSSNIDTDGISSMLYQ